MPARLASLDDDVDVQRRTTTCHRVPTDSRVHCVSLCPLPWANELLLYSTQSSVVVVKLALPDENMGEPGQFAHETLYKFSHASRVQCLTWCAETSLATIPQCVKFVTAGSDHVIYVHRRSSDCESDGLKVVSLRGHTDYVNSLAVSCDDHTLASVSDDCTCRLWHTRTHTPTATIRLTSSGVSVCWHGDHSERVLVCCDDGCVTLYNSRTVQPLSGVHVHSVLAGLADRRVMHVDWSRVEPDKLAVLTPHSLAVVNINSSRVTECELELTDRDVQQVHFSPINKTHVAHSSLNRVCVHQLGVKHTPLSVNIKCGGGISWHATRPYLAVGDDSEVLLHKILPV